MPDAEVRVLSIRELRDAGIVVAGGDQSTS